MPEQYRQASPLPVLQGGREPLSREQRQALSRVGAVVRRVSGRQANTLALLIEEFARDGYLQRMRPSDIGAVKILAEVITGWEPDGVREFARAWVSTLVARHDGFNWAKCQPREKREHLKRVEQELARRGVTPR